MASFSSFCTALSLNVSLRVKGKLHLLQIKASASFLSKKIEKQSEQILQPQDVCLAESLSGNPHSQQSSVPR